MLRILFILLTTACLNLSVEPLYANSDLTLYVNGVVYTANNQKFVEAFAVDNGRITAVGSNAEIERLYAAGATIVDLEEAIVLPGIIDSHTHILEANNELSGTCLVSRRGTPSAFVQILRECAPHQLATDWVLGYGFSIPSFLDSGENPLAAIDAAIPNRPAAIMEETSHATWVNSVALKVLGFDKKAANPTGGVIVRDAQGQPTGLLIDNAGDFAFHKALQRSKVVDRYHYEALLFGNSLLAENGITGTVDARVYWQRGFQEAYARAEAEGQLSARYILSFWAYPSMKDEDQLAKLKSLFRADDTELVQRRQIKVYVDGITFNTTARTILPYQLDFGFETPHGLNYFDEDRLTRYITELEQVGFDFNIHAIGDLGVREALNAIERAMQNNPEIKDRRHRITHVEHVHPADLARFASLGVIADIQLAGDFTEPRQFKRDSEPFLGKNNPALPLPARALIDSGAVVTLSSDYDVSDLNPLIGIANAIDRGKESLTVFEAIDAYTIKAAYLARNEHQVGSIEIGKSADFIILDTDIFQASARQIRNTRILATFFQGTEVFTAE